MEEPIQQYLMQLPDEKREVAIKLREIILAVNPVIKEAIKWNNLVFGSKKFKLAFVYTFKQVDYMNLGFMKAVKLSDPKNLFEGTGKGMRHIKIKTVKDIPVMQVKKWVKEALMLEQMVAVK